MLINLQERIQSLRELRVVASMLNNPEDTDSILQNILKLGSNFQASPLAEQMFRHLLANPAMAVLVESGWRPSSITLAELLALPEDSLGRCYALHLKNNGFTQDFVIDPRPITSPNDYIAHRIRETHDIIHVLTGFGTDGPGELGLQAFNLAQLRSPLAVLLIFGGLLKRLKTDEPLAPLLHALARGFEVGLSARVVLSFKLEDGWEQPLGEWRQVIGLPAVI